MSSILRSAAVLIVVSLCVGVAGCGGESGTSSSESNLNAGEQSAFVADGGAALTVEKKNQQLADALFEAPTLYRRIVRIERLEGSKGTGWSIIYRADDGALDITSTAQSGERSTFVADHASSVTVQQKNQQLSDELADAPTIHRTVVRIVRRDSSDGHGWWIVYRDATSGPP